MTTPKSGLTGDALAAARALYAVLSHPDAMKRGALDERFLEALLLRCLRLIPSLGESLFSAKRGTEYAYGVRGYADIVGHKAGASDEDDPSHLIEVKVWSKYNRSKAKDVGYPMQLDTYAKSAPKAYKFVAMPEARRGDKAASKAREEMESYPILTAEDWGVVTWEDVRDHLGTLLTPAQKKPADDTNLVIALGRMVP